MYPAVQALAKSGRHRLTFAAPVEGSAIAGPDTRDGKAPEVTVKRRSELPPETSRHTSVATRPIAATRASGKTPNARISS
jgi:hypothetical protein